MSEVRYVFDSGRVLRRGERRVRSKVGKGGKEVVGFTENDVRGGPEKVLHGSRGKDLLHSQGQCARTTGGDVGPGLSFRRPSTGSSSPFPESRG